MANQNYQLTLYHSCDFRENDSIDSLKDKIPFLSRKENQWLTQGYYFWTSFKDAQEWDVGNKRKAVFSLQSIFTDDSYLYDLVGNSLHKEHFKEIASMLETELFQGQKEITVAGVIGYLREKPDAIFKNVAVKATHKCTRKFRFIYPKKRRERLLLPEKDQICIFENTKNFVQFSNIKHCKSANDEILD